MVVLKLPGTLPDRTIIHGTDVTDIVGCILGVAGYGQLISLADKSDATNYTNTLGNADTTNGRALKVQYGASTTLATFAKAAFTTELPVTIKQVDLGNPSAGYTNFGARASDGLPVFRASGGAQTVLANAADSPSTILTATGSLIYASAANTGAERLIGTTHHVLTVSGGLPVWAAGSKATLSATGAMLYASAANVLASLTIGTTNQGLYVVGGIPAWGASTRSTLTTTGDIPYASSANTLARRGIGSSGDVLTVSGGLPVWSALPAGALPAGDGAANTPTINFTNATTAGLYRSGTGFGMTANGAAVATITTAGLSMQNNQPILPAAVSGTPAQNALYSQNFDKGWIQYTSVTTTAIMVSFNVTSVTDQAVGDTTITWDRDFGQAEYVLTSGVEIGAFCGVFTGRAAGTCRVVTFTSAAAAVDVITHVRATGTQ